jgi:hypothetical protein
MLIVFLPLAVNAMSPTSFNNKYPPALYGKKGAIIGRGTFLSG